MFVYGWSVLGLRFGLFMLSFYPVGIFQNRGVLLIELEIEFKLENHAASHLSASCDSYFIVIPWRNHSGFQPYNWINFTLVMHENAKSCPRITVRSVIFMRLCVKT